jgi:anti-anti-sigma factor
VAYVQGEGEQASAPRRRPGHSGAGQSRACQDLPATTGAGFFAAVTEDRQGRVVLALSGDLDLMKRRELGRVLSAIVETRRPATLVLDLTGVAFTDCSAVSVLISAQQRLAEYEGQIICANAQPIVRRLMSVRGVGSYLRLHDQRPAADGGSDEATGHD